MSPARLACAVLLAALPAAHAAPSRARPEVAAGKGSAAAPSGPVLLRVRSGEAAVEVAASADGHLRATVLDPPGVAVALRASGGDRLDLEFDGRNVLRRGRLRLEVPPQSRLDVESQSGPVSLAGVGGDVRLRTASGAVRLAGAAAVDVETIDGEVVIEEARGPARVHTVTGRVRLGLAGSAPQADVETASGDVEVSARCGRGCRLDADSVSGALTFALDPQSSFELRFVSHQGTLKDLGLKALAGAPERRGDDSWVSATLGAAEGSIECETFSGDVRLLAREAPKAPAAPAHRR